MADKPRSRQDKGKGSCTAQAPARSWLGSRSRSNDKNEDAVVDVEVRKRLDLLQKGDVVKVEEDWVCCSQKGSAVLKSVDGKNVGENRTVGSSSGSHVLVKERSVFGEAWVRVRAREGTRNSTPFLRTKS